MAGQPAWARFGQLQGVIMAGTGDPSPDAGRPIDADRFVALGQGPEVGRTFVLGGNAILTLQGSESRYTFRVQQGKPRDGEDPDRTQPYFLQLLTGPDNTADYQYIGIVDQVTGRVRLTRASRMTATSAPVVAWDWVMSRLFAGKAYSPAKVHHAGRCGRCGRLLTVPGSIETGFGPECSAKLGI